MKIYIHTDLEGITGIDNIDMMSREHARHHEALENLMLDLNAAVDGAFAGGADHVTVLDSHGGGGNFILA
jgi:D-amino peptidase